MTGCEHNIERVIGWPEQKQVVDKKTGRAYLSFMPVQEVRLICPRGCETISILLVSQNRENRESVK